MRERERQHDEPRLFDLPLEAEPEDGEPAAPPAADAVEADPAVTSKAAALEAEPTAGPAADDSPAEPVIEPGELPLFAPSAASAHEPPPEAPLGPRPVPDPEPAGLAEEPPSAAPTPAAEAPGGPHPAPFRSRLLATLADLGVYGLVFVVGLLGALMIGAAPVLAKLPAFGLFLLSFSFLYAVVSLAFWGQTPGMAAAGVVARGGGDRPLTFGQTGLRWVAGVVTAVLLGLPVLLALSGRSLADRLSGSSTYEVR